MDCDGYPTWEYGGTTFTHIQLMKAVISHQPSQPIEAWGAVVGLSLFDTLLLLTL